MLASHIGNPVFLNILTWTFLFALRTHINRGMPELLSPTYINESNDCNIVPSYLNERKVRDRNEFMSPKSAILIIVK